MPNLSLVTPTSHLFENEDIAFSIISVSDGLELRESMLLSYQQHRWGGVKLVHLDRVDITHPWNVKRQQKIEDIVLMLPELELVTFHVACNCSEPELRNNMYYSGGKVFSRDEMKNNAWENTQWLRSVVDEDLKIALENNNYYQTPAYDVVTDADFLREIVEDNNIYFLFDIAHAQVTAHNKNIDLDRYIDELPLDSVIQIHLCKYGVLGDGTASDLHEIPDELLIDYALKFINKYPVQYLTIEYYQNADKLINLLKYINTKYKEVLTYGS